MELIPFSFVIYFIVLAALVGPVAWTWRKRAAWDGLEAVSIVAPFVLWVLLLFIGDRPKTMNSLIVDPVGLGVAVSMIGWLRVAVAPRLGSLRATGLCMLAALVSAGLVWWLMPVLPE